MAEPKDIVLLHENIPRVTSANTAMADFPNFHHTALWVLAFDGWAYH